MRDAQHLTCALDLLDSSQAIGLSGSAGEASRTNYASLDLMAEPALPRSSEGTAARRFRQTLIPYDGRSAATLLKSS